MQYRQAQCLQRGVHTSARIRIMFLQRFDSFPLSHSALSRPPTTSITGTSPLLTLKVHAHYKVQPSTISHSFPHTSPPSSYFSFPFLRRHHLLSPRFFSIARRLVLSAIATFSRCPFATALPPALAALPFSKPALPSRRSRRPAPTLRPRCPPLSGSSFRRTWSLPTHIPSRHHISSG